MNAVVKGSWVVGMGILMASSGRPAHAAEGPLLVVVEAPPALDADAAEIRRAIGAELRSPTIAPTKTTGKPAGRALIVALDRDRIVVSLRAGDDVPITRLIPAPAEPAARLRAIAWLAGNLARDQVTPIVAEATMDMPSLATIPPETTLVPTTEPPALAAGTPATVPPEPIANAPTISTPARAPEIPAGHFWVIGAADGPTTNFPLCKPIGSGGWPSLCAPLRVYGTAWRVEVQRRSRGERLFKGVALEGTAGSDFTPQLIGTTAFIGFSRRYGRWSFEATIGAGLELSYVWMNTLTATHSSSDGFTSSITTDEGIRPALSAEGAFAVAHPILESLDAVLRVGAHVSTYDSSAWFLSVTLGLRYNLL